MKLATKIKRLLELADLLDRVPARKFKMSTFCSNLPPDMDPAREDECGTTACALEWATTLPFARTLGARVVGAGGLGNVNLGDVRTDKSKRGMATAHELFGVTREYFALFCFGPRTPKGKARQIRAFCKQLQEGAR